MRYRSFNKHICNSFIICHNVLSWWIITILFQNGLLFLWIRQLLNIVLIRQKFFDREHFLLIALFIEIDSVFIFCYCRMRFHFIWFETSNVVIVSQFILRFHMLVLYVIFYFIHAHFLLQMHFHFFLWIFLLFNYLIKSSFQILKIFETILWIRIFN